MMIPPLPRDDTWAFAKDLKFIHKTKIDQIYVPVTDDTRFNDLWYEPPLIK